MCISVLDVSVCIRCISMCISVLVCVSVLGV